MYRVPYGFVSLLTDYGLADGFVAACHGVLATLAPHARVLDMTHLVPAQDVRRGSVVLAQTVPHLPAAVHVAVVDPGVGTDRRAIVVMAGHSLLVGPDNGLLLAAAEALGGPLRPTSWLIRRCGRGSSRRLFMAVTSSSPRPPGSRPASSLRPLVRRCPWPASSGCPSRFAGCARGWLRPRSSQWTVSAICSWRCPRPPRRGGLRRR